MDLIFLKNQKLFGNTLDLSSHKLDKTILGKNQGMTNITDFFGWLYKLAVKGNLKRERIPKAFCL
jgi:hypothetical protein